MLFKEDNLQAARLLAEYCPPFARFSPPNVLTERSRCPQPFHTLTLRIFFPRRSAWTSTRRATSCLEGLEAPLADSIWLRVIRAVSWNGLLASLQKPQGGLAHQPYGREIGRQPIRSTCVNLVANMEVLQGQNLDLKGRLRRATCPKIVQNRKRHAHISCRTCYGCPGR